MLTIFFSIHFPYLTPFSSILSANTNFFFVKEKSVDLRVIDFDWVGKAGQVHDPAEQNTEIQCPGEAGGTIEQDGRFLDEGPTVELYFSIQIYSPGLSRRRALFCKKNRENKGAMNYNREVDCPRTAQVAAGKDTGKAKPNHIHSLLISV